MVTKNTLTINPLVGLTPRDVGGAAGSLLKVLGKAPRKTVTHYGHYLKELATVVGGRSALAPDPKDRRFADPAWTGNPFYTRLMQAYLATQKELTSAVETSKLDRVQKGRAQFFASLVTDALAPSNWVLGNPAAVRKIFDTGGDNLVKGLKNLVHDIRHNGMMPSQVDATPFKVGENIATSPGQVVHRDEMFELLQFAPTAFEILLARVQVKQAVNYGLEKVRFLAPLRAGARVRNHVKVAALEDKGRGRVLLTTENTIEIEGEDKPALVAFALVMLMS